MSDFLRNLRSSHKKELPNQRRNLDGHYYPQTDRRKIPDRRSVQSEGLEMLWSSLNELIPTIADNTSQLVESMTENQKDREMLIEAKIRQHNAISNFFDNLNRLLNDSFFQIPSENRPKATTSYASGTHYTKDDILKIIRTMRKDGATFAIIAEYLRDKGIPTFSGRGEWHAQTIHRLCK